MSNKPFIVFISLFIAVMVVGGIYTFVNRENPDMPTDEQPKPTRVSEHTCKPICVGYYEHLCFCDDEQGVTETHNYQDGVCIDCNARKEDGSVYAEDQNITVEFRYDGTKQTVTCLDSGESDTIIDYDAEGNVVSKTHFEYEFDENGNCIKCTEIRNDKVESSETFQYENGVVVTSQLRRNDGLVIDYRYSVTEDGETYVSGATEHLGNGTVKYLTYDEDGNLLSTVIGVE